MIDNELNDWKEKEKQREQENWAAIRVVQVSGSLLKIRKFGKVGLTLSYIQVWWD